MPSHPLSLDSDDVAKLDPGAFVRRMNRLLMAEALRQGIPPTKVATSLRINDPDGGIDASIMADRDCGPWLPAGNTIWQFKGGSPPTRADIFREVNKPGVRQGLAAGATYCLVVSADLIPTKLDQLAGQVREAVEAAHAGAVSAVFAAAQVAAWLSTHPSLLVDFGRGFAGFQPLDWWLQRLAAHRAPWSPDAQCQQLQQQITAATGAPSGPIHVRIEGKPGVGKSRLILETFRDIGHAVLYASEPPPTSELFEWMAAHPHAACVAIVDECDPSHAAHLAAMASLSEGRARVITVGHEEFTSTSPHLITLSPLNDESMLKVIEGVASTLTSEQAHWVASVARGFVKLATVLAEGVAKGQVSAVALTSSHDVQLVLRSLLPDQANRAAMEGLALLTRVGWDDDVASQGQAIARWMGLDWNAMRAGVGEMYTKGLVAKQGRYRYVTPEILALWLAGDACRKRGADLFGLMAELPTADAQRAMLGRIAHLRDIPEATEIINQLLGPSGPFDTPAILSNKRAAELLSVLARANPSGALTTLERLQREATHDDLLALKEARRELVWMLEALLADRSTFFRAARMLRRFAEAENETWSNNATGVWASAFQTFLAPTTVPAIERYALLDEALEDGRPTTRVLGVQGLEKALERMEFGPGWSTPSGGYAPPPRWRPATVGEHLACRRAALSRLIPLLNDGDPDLRTQARTVLYGAARDLAYLGLVDELMDALVSVQLQSDAERRAAWEATKSVLTYEDQFLSDVQRQRLHHFAESLLGDALADRMRRYLGEWSDFDWQESTTDEAHRLERVATALADEAIAKPQELGAMLPWLSSGEAQYAYLFGRRLGQLDRAREWLDAIVDAVKSGPDPRLLSAYLQGRAESGDSQLRDDLLDEWADDPSCAGLVFDATWRGTSSAQGVRRLLKLVDRGLVPPEQLGLLAWGAWASTLSAKDLGQILTRLVGIEHTKAAEGALQLLHQWHGEHPGLSPEPVLPLAWQLLERSAGLSGGPMLSWTWAKVGRALVEVDAVRAANAALNCVATEHFSFHDERLSVLRAALQNDPQRVWPVVGEQLVEGSAASFGLMLWAQDAKLLEELDVDLLMAWASEEPDRRLPLLAHAIKPREPLQPLVRALLAAADPLGPVGSALDAAFRSGIRMGSWASHEESKRSTVAAWMDDAEANVRMWAAEVMRGIDLRLPQIRRREEEDDLP